MTGTKLKRQQRAHASTTALEEPLPGSLLPSVLWFKPVGVSLQPTHPGRAGLCSEQPSQLPVDLDSLPRNPAIPWKRLLGVQPTGKGKQQKFTCGSFFQESLFREREQAG